MSNIGLKFGNFNQHAGEVVTLTARIPALISDIAKTFKTFECTDCTQAIVSALKKEGVSGEIVTLNANSTRRGYIYSETAAKLNGDGGIISSSGLHQGVLVDGKVYDNIHTNGIDYNDWLKDFEVLGGFKEPSKTKF